MLGTLKLFIATSGKVKILWPLVRDLKCWGLWKYSSPLVRRLTLRKYLSPLVKRTSTLKMFVTAWKMSVWSLRSFLSKMCQRAVSSRLLGYVKLDDYSKARTSARAYRNSRGNFVQSLLSRQLPLVIRGYLLRSSPRVVFQGCLRFLSCHFFELICWGCLPGLSPEVVFQVVFQGHLLRLCSKLSFR